MGDFKVNEKIEGLREKLKGLDLQGMIITNPISIRYLTGIQAEGVLLLTRRENVFITEATNQQSRIVITVIFSVPIIIILIGMLVPLIRRRRR